MDQQAVFSSYYLGPITFYYYLSKHSAAVEDINENFVKQTFRNRFYLLSPNGIQCHTIPLVAVKRKKKYKDVKICYSEDWNKVHWKSIESSYRRSPYFEYYEDEFEPLFMNKPEFLIDYNTELNNKIVEVLGLNVEIQTSEHYISADENTIDYRGLLTKMDKAEDLVFPEYMQVFNDRLPFAKNLSIIDLIFNEGPNSLNYLKSISK
jgi:hypothetical protein